MWGGIRHRLRPNEMKNGGRGEGGGDESDREKPRDEEDSVRQRDKEKVTRDSPQVSRNQETKEVEEGGGSSLKAHIPTSTGSPRVPRSPSSVERSGDTSSSSGTRDREATPEVHHRRAERGRRDGVKPTPNPKPTRLQGGQGSEGSSSESEGVKFSSLSGSLKLEVETVPESPKQRKNGQQRTTKPQSETSKHRQQPTHQDQRPTKPAETEAATTPQRKKRRPQMKERDSQNPGREGSSETAQPTLPTLPVFSPTDQQSLHSRPKPALPTKPVNLEKPVDGDVQTKLQRLQEMADENDYYRLFGVESSASTEDLARVRREMSRQLHPDHFAGQPDRQERFVALSTLLNSISHYINATSPRTPFI